MKLSLNCRGICENIGLVGNYEARTRVNVKLAKRKLMNMYSECWRENINARPKLEVYSTVKNTFETSGYVKALLTKKQCSLLCQLFCSVLPLEMELGHYIGTPRCNRICNICKNGVDDSIHFLFRCVELNKPRVESYYCEPNSLKYDEIERLKFLCNTPYRLGRFVEKLWQERECYLNSV